MKHKSINGQQMNSFSILVLIFVLVTESLAQNNGQCDIPEISEVAWNIRYTNDAIKDVDTLQKVFVAESNIELASDETTEYLNVAVVGSELIITTNENFANYEQNEQSLAGDHVITITILLNCETSEPSRLIFRQPVTDTNNHPPTFNSNSYTYELPMPLPANLEISYFGPTITVEDIDITNTNILFTINTEDFTVETEGPIDTLGKQFRPKITATKALRYTQSQQFILTATDTGTDPGPLSATAIINIEVDTDNSYPQTPSFTKAYYEGSYDASGDSPISIETISISDDYGDYASLELYLEGDYSRYFKAEFDGRNVQLLLDTDLPADELESETSIILALYAKEPEEQLTASAVLILKIVQEEYVEPPRFTKAYYTADYNLNAENNWDITTEEITIDYEKFELVDLDLEGDYKANFAVIRDGQTAKVSLVENLPTEVVEENSAIILTVVASVEGSKYKGNAALVISLPEQEDPDPPSFTKLYYSGSYQVSDSSQESDNVIVESIQISDDYTEYDSLKVTLNDDSYSKYFEVARTGRFVTVSVKENIPSDIIRDESHVVLTILAYPEDNLELIASTVLIISLPEIQTPDTPSFTNAYYDGKYTISDDGNHAVNVDGISISTDYENIESLNVVIQQTEYQKYFNPVKTGRTITIELIEDLPNSILQSQSVVVLTLVASTEGNPDLAGYTVVIIALPETEDSPAVELPSFTKPYYDGSYTISDDGNHAVKVEEVSISTDYENSEALNVVIQQTEYQKYFNPVKTGRTITIELIEDLPNSILQSQSVVVLTLVASTVANPDLAGYTVVIIALPETEDSPAVELPSFTKPYYDGSYTISDDGKHGVNVEEIGISTDYKDIESLNVIVQQTEYQKYLSPVKTGRTITIELNEDLPDSILQSQSVVVLTLVASTEKNPDLAGYAVVIIALPKLDDDPQIDSPTFTKPYYSGSYIVSDSEPELKLDEVTISENYEYYELLEVALQQEEYREYFSVNLNERIVEFVLQKKLPEATLNGQSIVLTLVASVKENSDLVGYTVVVISLPNIEDEPTPVAPTFTKSYYSGSYKVVDDEPDLTVESISISSDYNNLELVNVALDEEEYKKYFKVERIDTSFVLTLNEERPDDIFENKKIVLTIVASVLANPDLKGYTVVIISQLEDEEPSPLVPPSFTKPYYSGNYKINPNDDEQLTAENIIISEDYDDIESIVVTIVEEDYRNFFDFEQNERVFKLQLKEGAIPESELENKAVIVLTIVATAGELNGYAIVIISIDDSESVDSTIEFEEEIYKFNTDPERVGVIGVVKATSTSGEAISYSLTDESGSSLNNFEITTDTGVISNTENLDEGVTYNFVVHALGSESGTKNSAQVAIYVNIRSGYAALVRHVVEEEETTDIVILSDDNKERGLWYKIENQHPSDGTDLFKINSETGNLECVAIDREAPLISDMYLPQFAVTLTLYNPNENDENSIRKRSLPSEYLTDERTWVNLENDLPNVASQTVVFVVIDDINDNAPTFINTKQAIGYPVRELALQILPSYITVMEATDPDEGINARIQFGSNNEEFYVHPTSGVVYPTEALFDSNDKKVALTVTATDQDGAGLSTSFTTQVVLLEEDEISILSVEGMSLEDVDGKISELSSLLNLNIGYLSTSVVAASDVSRTITKASSSFYLRIVSYALDSDNEPVSGETLEDSIKDLNLDDSWSVQSWESYTKDTYNITKTSSNTGLLAAVIVLAILLALFIVAVAGGVYYFKYRRPNYATMIEDRDSPTVLKEEEKQTKDELPASPQFTGFRKNTTASKVSTKEEVVPPRRPTGLSFYTNGELLRNDDDDGEEKIVSTEISTTSSVENEVETTRERKKSVAFNENVERLELEKEDIVQSTDL